MVARISFQDIVVAYYIEKAAVKYEQNKEVKSMAENEEPKRRRQSPAKSLEARENQLISLAVNLAEEQLRSGTASSQVITHYLKLGSTRDRKEQEILQKQSDLLTAKTKVIESTQTSEVLYKEALEAMKKYGGSSG